MKKFRNFAIVLAIVVLASGCGNSKKLTCSMKDDMSGMETSQNVTVNFKDEKVEKINLSIDFSITDDSIKENFDEFSKMLDEQYENMESSSAVKLTTKSDKKNYKYNVTININAKDAKEEDLDQYGMSNLVDSKVSIEDAKKEFEDLGYTCK